MCLLAIFYRVADDAPVVLGANREESYSRGGSSPQWHPGTTGIVCPIDPLHGGTWIGINSHGMVAAVTNRRYPLTPKPGRSRGLLLLELLQSPNAKAASHLATKELAQNQYAPCNLFIADQEQALVVMHSEWLKVRTLPPGLHLITNGEINDEADPRVAEAATRLSWTPGQEATTCLNQLKTTCQIFHPNQGSICIKGEEKGTVSSTLMVLAKSKNQSQLWHASGSPHETPYQDFSPLLRNMCQP